MLNPSPGRWAPARVLADLERLALRAPTRAAFFDEAAARLKRAVLLAGASPLFARAVRRGVVTEACESTDTLPDAPGVLELDASGGLIRASSSAEPLLAELSGSSKSGVRSPRFTPSQPLRALR